jgi:hypothetical protein
MQSAASALAFLVIMSPAASCASAETAGEAAPDSQEARKDFSSLGVGAVYWRGLSDMQLTILGADPDAIAGDWGFHFEYAYRRHIARWGTADVLVGVDVALQQAGFYVTPSARLMVGEAHSLRPSFGGGVGWYGFQHPQHFAFGSLPVHEDGFGGYVSVGVFVPLSRSATAWLLGLENKVHFVDFGNPAGGGLSDPINTLQLGIVW